MKKEISIEKRIGNNKKANSPHFHFHCEMIFVEQGYLVINIEGTTTIIKENQVLIINSLENHILIESSSNCVRYIFRFSSDFLFESVKDPTLIIIFNRSSVLGIPVFTIPKDKINSIKELFSLILIELKNKETFYLTRCSVLLSAILITLFRIDSSIFTNDNNLLVKKIYEIQLYLNNNYQEKIKLEEIAYHFSISKYYMEHSFTKITGLSIKKYLMKIRLSNAKKLLCISEHNISSISYMIGFYDSNYFIKQFKKAESITPLQYRKQFICSNKDTEIKE